MTPESQPRNVLPHWDREPCPGTEGESRSPCRFAVRFRATAAFAAAVVSFALLAAPDAVAQVSPSVSTPEDRAALFDYLVRTTRERESLSPYKHPGGAEDVVAAMARYRDVLIGAGTDEELYYALARISAARRDRHLSVAPVDGGLRPASWRSDAARGGDATAPREAPIRFAADFSTGAPRELFVADLARHVSRYGTAPAVGDRLVAVGDRPFAEHVEAMAPYVRHSTDPGFWWKLAELVSLESLELPGALREDPVTYTLEREDGSQYRITVPYLEADSIEWSGHGSPTYPGFTLVRDVQTYDLWVHDELPVLVLDWYGFRENLVQDIDALMVYAEANGLLDHAVIVDATRSRGGSKGAYAIQRLSPKPFKTTFGNLRLSDITEAFVAGRRADYDARRVDDGGVSETVDDGRWQIEWLEGSVLPALHRGEDYSNDVPFKLAHAPPGSDGILEPAAIHFRGPLVVLLGPHGGSHLDQFVSIVVDNDLGHVIGMPAGGYSNTWEWEETLRFPISGRPVARYMWSIGHTIRPNGEILEGNPAPVHDYVPQTRENYVGYRDLLLRRALRFLELAPDVT